VARSDRQTDHRIVFFVLCVGGFAFALLQSTVSPVLPTFQRAFHTDQQTVTWVLTAYLLSASVFTPIIGRIGDKVGKERMLVLALLALSVGAVMAAVAPTIEVLILARVIQGVGGGVLPLTFGIIRDEFPREKVAGAIGTAAAMLAVGGGAGLVVAGPITDLLGFRWLFWLPALITAAAATAVHVFVPESPVRTPGRINVLTALLMSSWLVCLLLGVSQGRSWGWTSPGVLGLLLAGVVLLVVWVRTEYVSDAPLIDMQMMQLPAVWTTNVVALLFGVVLYTNFAFLPQFLQTDESAGYGFGLSVTASGLFLLPQAVATFVVGLLSGRLAARHGSKRVLVAGAIGTAAAMLGMVFVHEQLWEVLVISILNGTAFGLAFAAMSNIVVESVPRSQTGVASGMNTNIRTVGGAIGAAVVASVVTSSARADGLPLESGYTFGFLVLAVCAVAAAGLCTLIPSVREAEVEDLVGMVRTPEAGAVAGGQLVAECA
jgi:EmrB/QacA subfamily drug resistance transporter